jgi:hypothetical protein
MHPPSVHPSLTLSTPSDSAEARFFDGLVMPDLNPCAPGETITLDSYIDRLEANSEAYARLIAQKAHT